MTNGMAEESELPVVQTRSNPELGFKLPDLFDLPLQIVLQLSNSLKDDLQEIFWLAKHSARMTGMPAFGPSHDDATLWGIAAFAKGLAENPGTSTRALCGAAPTATTR